MIQKSGKTAPCGATGKEVKNMAKTSRLAAVANVIKDVRTCESCGKEFNMRSTSLGITIWTCNCEAACALIVQTLDAAGCPSKYLTPAEKTPRWLTIEPLDASALAARS
jgi:ribosomal protein L37AE/L43A